MPSTVSLFARVRYFCLLTSLRFAPYSPARAGREREGTVRDLLSSISSALLHPLARYAYLLLPLIRFSYAYWANGTQSRRSARRVVNKNRPLRVPGERNWNFDWFSDGWVSNKLEILISFDRFPWKRIEMHAGGGLGERRAAARVCAWLRTPHKGLHPVTETLDSGSAAPDARTHSAQYAIPLYASLFVWPARPAGRKDAAGNEWWVIANY